MSFKQSGHIPNKGFLCSWLESNNICFIDKYNRNKNKRDIKLPIAPDKDMYCIRLIDGKFVQNRYMYM